LGVGNSADLGVDNSADLGVDNRADLGVDNRASCATDLNDLYLILRVSAQGGAFWRRGEAAPHLGVKSPKNPFWV